LLNCGEDDEDFLLMSYSALSQQMAEETMESVAYFPLVLTTVVAFGDDVL
jgi:hypothetical protein